MYMQGYKCNVTNSVSTTPIGTPKPPVWCEGAPSNCTQGPKQIIAWNQKTGNNIEVQGFDLAGDPKSPAYNMKCGFKDGEFVKKFLFSFLFFLFFFFFVYTVTLQVSLIDGNRCSE